MPMGPISGRVEIERLIAGIIGAWPQTESELCNVLCTGNVVVAERVDRIRAGANLRFTAA
ncbi:MAG TPA: hypothetical protein VMR50_06750 [Myxococcota bacterium]|nr:hypothetical protein [Myxococcota bacterium]